MALLDFSSSDLRTLREMIAEHKSRAPRKGGSFGAKFLQELHDWQASDVYVALPLVDIPALSGTETGSAECDIYRVETSGSLSKIGLSITVFNTGDTNVPAGEYVPIARTKFGQWIVLKGGGSSLTPFQIISVDELCCYADAVLYNPHDCVVAEGTGTGTDSTRFRVYDLLGCDLGGGAGLIGTVGWATKRLIDTGLLCGNPLTGTGTGDVITGTGTTGVSGCTSEYVIVRLCCGNLV